MKELDEQFHVTKKDADEIIARFHDEMRRGLRGGESSLKMIPAYIGNPSGHEKGSFIGVDLGGTNLRVFVVDLDGAGKYKTKMHQVSMAKSGEYNYTKDVSREEFFDFIVGQVTGFLVNEGYSLNEPYNLGFTFSFPAEQRGIDSGRLIKWTKEWAVPGVEGEDVVKLLQEGFVRNGKNKIKVTAMINDTVATELMLAYKEEHCGMALIYGTGTNMCVLLPTEQVVKLSGYSLKNIILNAESGGFDKLPRNYFDEELDRQCGTKGQVLEKMVSGKYLGELAREVFAKLVDERKLFSGKYGNIFSKVNAVNTIQMSKIEADKSGGLENVEKILRDMNINDSSMQDRKLVQDACAIVSTRSAKIIAIKISAFVKWLDPELREEHTVAVDGSIYENYYGIKNRVNDMLSEILGEKANGKVRLELAKDASGIGAAIAAAIV